MQQTSRLDRRVTAALGNTTVLYSTPGTSHSIALSGLRSSTLYYYKVRSRDASGNLGESGVLTFKTAAIAIYAEAESGALTAPMQAVSSAAASGGRYVVVPNGATSGGRVAITFTVPEAGTYVFSGRTISPTTSDDSFHASVDASVIDEDFSDGNSTYWSLPTNTTWT